MTLEEKINHRPFGHWGLPNEIGCSVSNEDMYMHELLGGKQNGYIVDVGANDGITGSNSFKLINKYNWNAILIEPHPTCTDYLNNILYKDNDKVKIENIAIDTELKQTPFYFGSTGCCGIHSINVDFVNSNNPEYFSGNSIIVETNTLNNILNKYKVPCDFDILSVDCEGNDIRVIQSMNIKDYFPKLICIERDDFDDNVKIRNLLSEYGYTDLMWFKCNIIFKRNDLLF